jgi:hypothetical protein
MKTLREMINLIESVNAPADGYLLMLYNYPYSIHKTPEEAQVAIKNSGESDGSWKVVPFQFGANLGEGVAEGLQTRTCPQCDGSGKDTLYHNKPCQRCNGKGHVPVNKDQDVAEDQATAQMGLMSAMGSNSDAPDRKQQAAQAIERLYNK